MSEWRLLTYAETQDGHNPMDRPKCESCVHWQVATWPKGICSRFPELQDKADKNFCGEHQDFPKWIEQQRGE